MVWFLKKLWAGWKKFAFLLGTVNRIVLLTIFYWVMINVSNLFIRLFRIDLLDRRMRQKATYWNERLDSPKTYKHQF